MTDSKFEDVGTLTLSSSGKSCKLSYLGFITCFVSLKDLKLVLEGKAKTAPIWKVKRRE
ncbi:hypothetical protein KAU88_05685 [Candidatus Bathyarchaeota archaeon]|nr:hypothetical protein [Candidatus Bathyarchaeota archaeon]